MDKNYKQGTRYGANNRNAWLHMVWHHYGGASATIAYYNPSVHTVKEYTDGAVRAMIVAGTQWKRKQTQSGCKPLSSETE